MFCLVCEFIEFHFNSFKQTLLEANYYTK